MDDVIEVSGLRKTYGSLVAVKDVSFSVHPGEIFGILGPNGAGKTTTVESIAGLRRPDAGTVRVLGLDPERDGRQLRQRLGVQLQQATRSGTVQANGQELYYEVHGVGPPLVLVMGIGYDSSLWTSARGAGRHPGRRLARGGAQLRADADR